MTIYIAVISHHHTRDIIDGLKPHLINAQRNLFVVIKDNEPCSELAAYCLAHDIEYLPNRKPQGFGHNNNDIFLYCRLKHGMEDSDLFVVLNPDVIVQPDVFEALDAAMNLKSVRLAAPNLFRDERMQILEGSIRIYPMPWDFVTSFVLKSRKTTLQRHHIDEAIPVDWASGAFLAFRAGLYRRLSGFDPKYYLYCEDIDICWRAKVLLNEPTLYLPNIKAVHKGHRDSHSLFSHYFRWHVSSAMKFSSRFLLWKWFGRKPTLPRQLR